MDMEVIGFIIFGTLSAITLLLTVSFSIFLIVRAFRGGGNVKSRAASDEETEMIQEMYHGFQRMGTRVEALETLLLNEDRQQRKASDFDKELNEGRRHE